MAFLLASEQPAAAAVTISPVRALFRWVSKVRAARAQRVALTSLLEFDTTRLDDLGINRQDLFDAIHNPSRHPGATLSERRATKSSAWLGQR